MTRQIMEAAPNSGRKTHVLYTDMKLFKIIAPRPEDKRISVARISVDKLRRKVSGLSVTNNDERMQKQRKDRKNSKTSVHPDKISENCFN